MGCSERWAQEGEFTVGWSRQVLQSRRKDFFKMYIILRLSDKFHLFLKCIWRGWRDGSARLLSRRSWVQIPATTWWLTTTHNEIWLPFLVHLKTATVYLCIIINNSLKNLYGICHILLHTDHLLPVLEYVQSQHSHTFKFESTTWNDFIPCVRIHTYV